MKKILFVLSLLIISASGHAATKTIQASWTYSAADQANITGFKLCNADKTPAVASIAPTARAATWQTDFSAGQCRSYYMVAVTATGESANSEVVQVCEGIKEIIIPTGIGIKFQ